MANSQAEAAAMSEMLKDIADRMEGVQRTLGEMQKELEKGNNIIDKMGNKIEARKEAIGDKKKELRKANEEKKSEAGVEEDIEERSDIVKAEAIIKNQEEKKSKTQAEAKIVLVDKGEKEDEKEPIEQETEGEKELKVEHLLKLQSFSGGVFEVDSSNNPKEMMKPRSFQSLQPVTISPSSPKIEVQQIDVARAEATMKMETNCDVEKTWEKHWRYDKRRRDRLKAELKIAHALFLFLREEVEVVLCREGRKRSLEEERGFRDSITQLSIVGPKLVSAQPFFSRVSHILEVNREVLSAASRTDSTKKRVTYVTENHRGTIPAFASSENVKTTESKLVDWKIDSNVTLRLLGEFSLLRDANTTTRGDVEVEEVGSMGVEILCLLDEDIARSSEFGVALYNDWVLGSRDCAQVASPLQYSGSYGEIRELANYKWIFEANYWAPSFEQFEALKRFQVKAYINMLFVCFAFIRVIFWVCKRVQCVSAKAYENRGTRVGSHLLEVRGEVAIFSLVSDAKSAMKGKLEAVKDPNRLFWLSNRDQDLQRRLLLGLFFAEGEDGGREKLQKEGNEADGYAVAHRKVERVHISQQGIIQTSDKAGTDERLALVTSLVTVSKTKLQLCNHTSYRVEYNAFEQWWAILIIDEDQIFLEQEKMQIVS